MAISVDPGRDQSVHTNHPALLTHFDRQRIEPHEGVRAGIQQTFAKRHYPDVPPSR
jgi:hypothetical protein